MTDLHNYQQPLSEQGRQRRDGMLTELTAHMHHVYAARRKRRRGAVASLLVLVTAGVVYTAAQTDRATAPLSAHHADTNEPAVRNRQTTPPLMTVEFVKTDSSILDRYRVSTRQPNVQPLSDEDLLRTLNRLNRPVGLIKMEGHTMLTGLVADADFDPPQRSCESPEA